MQTPVQIQLLREKLFNNLFNLSLSPLYDQKINYYETIHNFVFSLPDNQVENIYQKSQDPAFLPTMLVVLCAHTW